MTDDCATGAFNPQFKTLEPQRKRCEVIAAPTNANTDDNRPKSGHKYAIKRIVTTYTMVARCRLVRPRQGSVSKRIKNKDPQPTALPVRYRVTEFDTNQLP